MHGQELEQKIKADLTSVLRLGIHQYELLYSEALNFLYCYGGAYVKKTDTVNTEEGTAVFNDQTRIEFSDAFSEDNIKTASLQHDSPWGVLFNTQAMDLAPDTTFNRYFSMIKGRLESIVGKYFRYYALCGPEMIPGINVKLHYNLDVFMRGYDGEDSDIYARVDDVLAEEIFSCSREIRLSDYNVHCKYGVCRDQLKRALSFDIEILKNHQDVRLIETFIQISLQQCGYANDYEYRILSGFPVSVTFLPKKEGLDKKISHVIKYPTTYKNLTDYVNTVGFTRQSNKGSEKVEPELPKLGVWRRNFITRYQRFQKFVEASKRQGNDIKNYEIQKVLLLKFLYVEKFPVYFQKYLGVQSDYYIGASDGYLNPSMSFASIVKARVKIFGKEDFLVIGEGLITNDCDFQIPRISEKALTLYYELAGARMADYLEEWNTQLWEKVEKRTANSGFVSRSVIEMFGGIASAVYMVSLKDKPIDKAKVFHILSDYIDKLLGTLKDHHDSLIKLLSDNPFLQYKVYQAIVFIANAFPDKVSDLQAWPLFLQTQPKTRSDVVNCVFNVKIPSDEEPAAMKMAVEEMQSGEWRNKETNVIFKGGGPTRSLFENALNAFRADREVTVIPGPGNE